MGNHNIRLLMITNTYAPYRVPVWKALSKTADEFLVLLLAKNQDNRLWEATEIEGLRFEALASKARYIPKIDNYIYFGGNVIKAIRMFRPTHIVLSGYHQPAFIKTIIYSRLRKIPLVQWFESHSESSYYSMGVIHWIRKNLLRLADSWIVPGTLSLEYLIDMGISRDMIVIAPNVIDTSIFNKPAWPSSSNKARILFVGRYVHYKGVEILVEAFRKLSEEVAVLRLVGHGPLENKIKELVRDISNIGMMPAAKSPDEMSLYYAWADIVVFPTLRDTWGLVVNEALASGCYVLSSALAGATPDLIEKAPVEVGKVIHPDIGIEGISKELWIACSRIEEIRSTREHRKKWGQSLTPDLCKDRILKALRLAVGLGAR